MFARRFDFINNTKAYALTVLLLSALPLAAQQNDWLIVAGQRVGPITLNSTRADLDRFFGNANVHDEPVDTGNGPEQATVVYSAKPGMALSISWSGSRIANILICYSPSNAHCKWRTREGITIGTPLGRLEKLNGRPFQFNAWGSDPGGSIVSWQSGRLAPLLGEGNQTKLWISINYPQPPAGPTPAHRRWVKQVYGRDNVRLSSHDEAVRHLHPVVDGLNALFETR